MSPTSKPSKATLWWLVTFVVMTVFVVIGVLSFDAPDTGAPDAFPSDEQPSVSESD